MTWQYMCIVLLLVVGLSGCMVGPNYRAPQAPVPAAWSEAQQGAAPMTQWWTTFKDPLLDSLIARAVQSNWDLRTAAGRVREARAQRGVAGADLWPTIDASGSYTWQRASENAIPLSLGGASNGTSGGPAPFLQGLKLDQDLFQTGFDASWEVDLFGGVRRSIKAADADLEASQDNLRDTLVSLLAEVARNYVEVRGFQRRLAIAQENLHAQRDTLELTRARFNAGLTSELDVEQAASQPATTQSQIPPLETSLKQGIHRLAVLTGQAPGALLEELSTAAPIPTAAPTTSC
jgi:outer membrane protein, multidrug efflux system